VVCFDLVWKSRYSCRRHTCRQLSDLHFNTDKHSLQKIRSQHLVQANLVAGLPLSFKGPEMIVLKPKATRFYRRKNLAVLGQSCCIEASNWFQSQSVRHLNLAYALHEPPKTKSPTEVPAVIIMHGLFGSKQNNRSISKYGSLCALAKCTILILILMD